MGVVAVVVVTHFSRVMGPDGAEVFGWGGLSGRVPAAGGCQGV